VTVLHEIRTDSDDESSDEDKNKKKIEDTNLGDFEIVGDLPVRRTLLTKKGYIFANRLFYLV